MEDRRAMYGYFGVLIAFKLWTLILILWLTSTWQAVIFVVASHALWIGTVLVVMIGPASFWMRLVRVRAKRRRLQEAEWRVEDPHESLK